MNARPAGPKGASMNRRRTAGGYVGDDARPPLSSPIRFRSRQGQITTICSKHAIPRAEKSSRAIRTLVVRKQKPMVCLDFTQMIIQVSTCTSERRSTNERRPSNDLALSSSFLFQRTHDSVGVRLALHRNCRHTSYFLEVDVGVTLKIVDRVRQQRRRGLIDWECHCLFILLHKTRHKKQ